MEGNLATSLNILNMQILWMICTKRHCLTSLKHINQIGVMRKLLYNFLWEISWWTDYLTWDKKHEWESAHQRKGREHQTEGRHVQRSPSRKEQRVSRNYKKSSVTLGKGRGRAWEELGQAEEWLQQRTPGVPDTR